MDVSLEIRDTIILHVTKKSDVASLCRVCKAFRHSAELALYNTLIIRERDVAVNIAETVANHPQISDLVEAITVSPDINTNGADSSQNVTCDDSLDAFWRSISRILHYTPRLRHLNLQTSTNPSTSWILQGCTFQLESFTCDLAWDAPLVLFLEKQADIRDLYLADFAESAQTLPSLSPLACPRLTIFECPIFASVPAFVSGRPITHLKTYWVASHESMAIPRFLRSLQFSLAIIRSIDVVDLDCSEEFSIEWLSLVAESPAIANLRYAGTLVLPIREQAGFAFLTTMLYLYAALMRFLNISAIALDVSQWYPSPVSPVAMRALANEVHLYQPSITRILFVHGDDDYSMAENIGGNFTTEGTTFGEDLWREI
ncbi:hypothetical protein FISHEDRAFT_35221 [Fistulina hepatica ATCC 64428]|uniref:F-box domain-containing protein n=1 Tax=Fistulina hepatica ATCC 64428 TaxID=1128425 RepID=A0A0D7AKS5_9AGAR|nr:hypothetical protein FISHEDRAFT_35221 [Fistulina hepatica ATCC 64428]